MLDIRPLTPDHADDWLAFFDELAFADNPEWSGCYCRVSLFGEGSYEDWGAACDANANRGPMVDAIRRGTIDGLLAREDGRVVAWTHFGPTARFHPPGGNGPLQPADEGIASIVCFVVAHTHRRRGIATKLLNAALEELARRGFTAVDARPRPDDNHEPMELFKGPRVMYEAAGFEQVEDGPRVRLRRQLRP